MGGVADKALEVSLKYFKLSQSKPSGMFRISEKTLKTMHPI